MFVPRLASSSSSSFSAPRRLASAVPLLSRRSLSSLVWIEHKRGLINPATLSAVTAAQSIGGDVRSHHLPVEERKVKADSSAVRFHRLSFGRLQVAALVTGKDEDVKSVLSKVQRYVLIELAFLINSGSCPDLVGLRSSQHPGPVQGLHLELAKV